MIFNIIFKQQHDLNLFDYTPLTFIIDLDDVNLEVNLQEFVKCYQRFTSSPEDLDQVMSKFSSILRTPISHRAATKSAPPQKSKISKNYKLPSTFYRGCNMWLLKPVDFNRGRGIEIFSTLDNFKNLLTHGKY